MMSESIVVMKGGVMSSFYYLVYNDELLNNLELNNLGACVMSTYVGNPSFADDLALVAIVPSKLQKLCVHILSHLAHRCQCYQISHSGIYK